MNSLFILLENMAPMGGMVDMADKVEKEEHQGCCGRIPGIRPEQESCPRFRHPKNRNESRNVQTRK